MLRTILSPLLTVVAMLLLLVLSMHWWVRACFPFEIHTFKWLCEIGTPLVALSFAIPGFIYGATVARSPWFEGFAISIIASVLAGIASYFQPLFGGTSMVNATAAVFYAVLPGLLGVLAGSRLRSLRRRGAA